MIKKALVGLILLVLCACTSQEEIEFKAGKKEVSQGHFRIALGYFDRVIKRNSKTFFILESAREAARVSFYETRDFKKAVQYYQILVLKSDNELERVQSQKQIASIYFDNLQDYKQAIIEYSKLQQMNPTDIESAQYKLNIARAQYYLNDFFQAESEINALLKLKGDPNTQFTATMLKGNILVAKKEFEAAAGIFKSLIEKYPEKAFEENVALVLAVCYEENLDFKNAIAVLREIEDKYQPKEYIELRIKRLQERQKNAPGAKGFRK
ncbi:hypothetical protein BDW_00030 [Bdellovibrio bacteriovorus W]|nr:hypothetical protein BDW_00030 [Bdellovibrio bacteriovorus W]